MKTFKSILGIMLMCALDAAAQAEQNLVQNGSFETTSNGGGQLGYNTNASGWSVNTSDSYIFLYTPGSADNGGETGESGKVKLWGPNDGASNGMPATSPDGGNFIAADGDYLTSPLTQAIAGLIPGRQYTLSFDYAFAQQYGYTGDTKQNWSVSLGGGASFTTPTYSLPSKGFSGWMTETVTLTAGSSNDLLSFLAYGNLPVPPFALLDGVSLVSAGTLPEPGVLALCAAGMLGMCARPRTAQA